MKPQHFFLQVSPKHAGEYTCQPYNIRGSQGKSKPMTIEIRDPPTIVRRPEAEYQRNVGGKVTMPCQAAGPPKVSISWRRVSLLFWFVYTRMALIRTSMSNLK